MNTTTILPFARPDITEEEVQAVVAIMRSGWLTTGPTVAQFEKEFGEFLGSELYAVAVNSATAGLHLAVEAIGLEPGDEVLVPTWTFTATAEVVRYMGATPVFVDVDERSLNIDLAEAQKMITPRTKAIIPVHFAGLPVHRQSLTKFAGANRLQVIEDAAHAFPVWDGTGYLGAGGSAATVFSFYATKTITTGEGGMLVTRNEQVANRARTMRLHGISRDVFDRYRSPKASWAYDVVAPGYKYNMMDLSAAIGRVQLRRAESMRASRGQIAAQYVDGLQKLPVELPMEHVEAASHAHHLFVIKIADDARVSRDQFIERLAADGIGTSVHFIPLHQQPYWRQTYDLDNSMFPVSSRAIEKVVSLPLSSSMRSSDVERVVQSVKTILKGNTVTSDGGGTGLVGKDDVPETADPVNPSPAARSDEFLSDRTNG